jgi:hypothetical protein
MSSMGAVVDLTSWRNRRAGSPVADGDRSPDADTSAPEAGMSRLDRAVERLHRLVSRALDANGNLSPTVETELLAIMGELTVGLVPQAARRAERLADRLARPS